MVSGGDYAVSEHVTANMSVNIATGQAWVPGTSASAQGLYYIRNAATVNLAISASDTTNPRVEKIVLRIKDEAYSGTENEAVLEVVKGTAEAGAKLEGGGKAPKGVGATPASSIILAYVLVPAKATSIVAADIENVAPPLAARTPLAIRSSSVSTTVNPGELVIMQGTGTTATLASPTANAMFGVLCGTGATSVKVKGAGLFYGGPINGASELTLATLRDCVIQGGGAEYLIIGGEPQREVAYTEPSTARTSETEYEPSATHETYVILVGNIEKVTVNGELIMTGTNVGSLGFYVGAGKKWKAKGTSLATTYQIR